MMTQKFNHQLEILQEGKNLNINSVDKIANKIKEFHYDSESRKTFALWYKRWIDIFQYKLSEKDEYWKIRLLIRKLGIQAANGFHIYRNSRTAKKIFGKKQLLFNTQFNYLQTHKRCTPVDPCTWTSKVWMNS